MKDLELADLVALVARLRAEDGCPWDRRQTLAEVRAYLVEEAHELAGAIDQQSWEAIREELGDLLFQAAFIARLAEEQEAFRLADAIAAIHEKMITRHPHVFGGAPLATAEDVQRAWEKGKARARPLGSHLDGVPASLPALIGAYRLGQKAGGLGFDWPSAEPVLDKVHEELAEVAAAPDLEHTREEIGDLLFALASYARHRGVDPEAALAQANLKFRRRFAAMETLLAERGSTLASVDASGLDQLWREVKEREREGPGSESL